MALVRREAFPEFESLQPFREFGSLQRESTLR